MAGLGAGPGVNGGFWYAATEIVHVAVGVITFDGTVRFPAASFSGYPPIPSYDPGTQWAWLYNLHVTTDDAADMAYCRFLIVYPDRVIGAMMSTATGMEPRLLFNGTAVISQNITNTLPNNWVDAPIPLLLPHQADTVIDTFLRCISSSGGAGTVENNFYNLFWVGPKGTMPPKVS